MKRPVFLTVWLTILFLLSIAMTIDSLTYLRFIFLTKSYISLLGIIAGFVQIWSIVQLFKWKKVGISLLLVSMTVIFIVTGVNEFYILSKISQILMSMLIVFAVNMVMLGILYLAIKPVWKNFK